MKTFVSDWVSRFRKWGKEISAALEKLAAGRSVPYAAVYDVPAGFRIPADFAVSSYKGLALCHVISNPAPRTQRLVVYWQTEAHCQAHSTSLERELHLPSSSSGGLVLDVLTKRPGWLTRLSWLWKGAFITGTAALFAAVIALHGYVAQAVETPDVQISFPDMTPLDLTSGTSINVAVRILNDSVYAHTTLTYVNAVAKPESGGDAVPLTAEWIRIPRLEAGQSTEITLNGTAPPRQSPNGPLEIYDIEVTIDASTGLVHRRAKRFKTTISRQIDVWPAKIGSTCATVLHGAGRDGKPDDAAQLQVWLLPGASYPKGDKGHAQITSAPDEITKISVADYQTTELPLSPPGTAITREVEFQVPKLESLKKFPLLINLEATKPLHQDRWNDLIACANLQVLAE